MLNTALGHYKCSSKFDEKQESYQENYELLVCVVKPVNFPVNMIPSRQFTASN